MPAVSTHPAEIMTIQQCFFHFKDTLGRNYGDLKAQASSCSSLISLKEKGGGGVIGKALPESHGVHNA